MTVLKIKNASDVFEDIPAIKGGQGYYVNNVYKKSGTGAAGTTDVYGMKINDTAQTEVGTFSVYNGTDGQVSGDMTKASYDTNEDGKVNYADVADAVAWSGITGKPTFADVATSGDYEDLSNTPTIPTALSDLTADATHRLVTDTEKTTWNAKANASDIPDELADLTADATHRLVTDTEKATWSAKANTSDIPTKTSDLTNDSGFLTSHQSLASYRTSAAQDVIDASKQDTISDLTTIRSGASAGATAYQKPASGIPASDLAETYCLTTDSRLSDARTPTAHTHSASDITDLNSTSAMAVRQTQLVSSETTPSTNGQICWTYE